MAQSYLIFFAGKHLVISNINLLSLSCLRHLFDICCSCYCLCIMLNRSHVLCSCSLRILIVRPSKIEEDVSHCMFVVVSVAYSIWLCVYEVNYQT